MIDFDACVGCLDKESCSIMASALEFEKQLTIFMLEYKPKGFEVEVCLWRPVCAFDKKIRPIE